MRGIHGSVEGQHVTGCELGGLDLVSVPGREGVQRDHVLEGSFQVPSLGTVVGRGHSNKGVLTRGK